MPSTYCVEVRNTRKDGKRVDATQKNGVRADFALTACSYAMAIPGFDEQQRFFIHF
jgi:hypothetical protein